MAIYTPRGLKIRFCADYAFALMARIHPDVSAYRVLRTAEGIESINSAMGFFAAVIAFAIGADPFSVAVAVFVANSIGRAVTYFGPYALSGITRLGTLVSYVEGFGVLFGIVAALGYVRAGWRGPVYYLVASAFAEIAGEVVDFVVALLSHRKIGFPLTASERGFLNAYRLHAGLT